MIRSLRIFYSVAWVLIKLFWLPLFVKSVSVPSILGHCRSGTQPKIELMSTWIHTEDVSRAENGTEGTENKVVELWAGVAENDGVGAEREVSGLGGERAESLAHRARAPTKHFNDSITYYVYPHSTACLHLQIRFTCPMSLFQTPPS